LGAYQIAGGAQFAYSVIRNGISPQFFLKICCIFSRFLSYFCYTFYKANFCILNMAQIKKEIIEALRQTAKRLEEGAPYAWSHMGSCNCGHLAQTLTKYSKEEIHRKALEKAGDWAEHIEAYCPSSGYTIDHIIDTMLEAGFTREDLIHLERLSDKKILERIPQRERPLDYRKRENIILYFRTWADMLEEALQSRQAQSAPQNSAMLWESITQNSFYKELQRVF
jgi:hypothetical protein